MIDLTDDEKGELVRAWLQRYALVIIAAIVIVIAAIAGYEWFQNQRSAQAQAQSAELIALNTAVAARDDAQATALYGAISEDSQLKPTAALLMATLALAGNDSTQAAAYLNDAANSEDPLVVQTANWQRVQLHIAAKDYPAATQTLQALKGSAYEQQIPLLHGIIAQRQGDDQAALDAYQRALNDNPRDAAFIEAQIAALQGQMAVESQP